MRLGGAHSSWAAPLPVDWRWRCWRCCCGRGFLAGTAASRVAPCRRPWSQSRRRRRLHARRPRPHPPWRPRARRQPPPARRGPKTRRCPRPSGRRSSPPACRSWPATHRRCVPAPRRWSTSIAERKVTEQLPPSASGAAVPGRVLPRYRQRVQQQPGIRGIVDSPGTHRHQQPRDRRCRQDPGAAGRRPRQRGDRSSDGTRIRTWRCCASSWTDCRSCRWAARTTCRWATSCWPSAIRSGSPRP